MTEFMSRRERREAEKSGQLPRPEEAAAPQAAIAPATVPPAPESPVLASQASDQPLADQPLSRRELRERERSGLSSRLRTAVSQLTSSEVASQNSSQVAREDGESPGDQVLVDSNAEVAQIPVSPAPESPVFLPDVSLSSQVNVVEGPAFVDPVYLSEPSTNSIVLDRIPDAVGVPIDVTGEIITTGSIAILTEPVDTVLTGPLDDRALDSISANDAITGAITIVEPVSALEVIKNRPNQSVLPVRSLKSGWWKPLLLAVATLVMVTAAVVAALVIINTLGL